MSASLVIEEEAGTFNGRVHAHNGYYSGNFFPTEHNASPVESPSTGR